MLADDITSELLLTAYLNGLFPMSEDRSDKSLFWVEPEERGIFPLDKFHCSKSLRKLIRKMPYTVKINTAFRQVMQACAAPNIGRMTTWISHEIEDIYCDLHDQGFAHSIECWDNNQQLVGGLYGVCIAGGFFGESMFSKQNNASKVALTYLVARLIHGKFTLLDSQFQTDHLKTLGCIEIKKQDYKLILQQAMHNIDSNFYSLPIDTPASEILQLVTHTS